MLHIHGFTIPTSSFGLWLEFFLKLLLLFWDYNIITTFLSIVPPFKQYHILLLPNSCPLFIAITSTLCICLYVDIPQSVQCYSYACFPWHWLTIAVFFPGADCFSYSQHSFVVWVLCVGLWPPGLSLSTLVCLLLSLFSACLGSHVGKTVWV